MCGTYLKFIYWNYVFLMKCSLLSKSIKLIKEIFSKCLYIGFEIQLHHINETSSLKRMALFPSYDMLFVLFLAIFQTLILNFDFGTAKTTHFEQGSTTSWQAQCADCTCKTCRYFEATKIWCQTPHMLLI